MSQELEELRRDIALMDEAVAFLDTPIGRYLVGRAEAEREEAMTELAVCDPEDAKGIRELQNRIYRADSIQGWLAEAITSGEAALQTQATLDATD